VGDHGQGGFTLVELLVAMMVTVIGLVGLMSLHVSLIKGNRDASRFADASAVAQQTMEDLRTMNFALGKPNSIVDIYGPLPITDAVLDTVDGRAGMTYYRTFSAVQLANTLVRFHVEVSWMDDGSDPTAATPADGRHEVTLELIRTNLEQL
jgi:prepilin-type N-terminal cleavage/methylation domain-containing protein